ncbi:MAG TPA: polymorphic toxin-type HINT domain-containing protein, partial [Polyangiaceae bacterium]|nr:polymorphic toxin-type HINT domain-containing protein [Polyangiaceae bacterium]
AIPGVNVVKFVQKGGKIARVASKVASHLPDSKHRPDVHCEGAACRKAGEQCFAAGTLVHTADGPLAIESVATGDLIWSRSEQTGAIELRRVARRFVTPDQPVERLVFETPAGALEALTVTPEHPFWTLQGWTAASRLTPGDRVLLRSGGEVVVRGVEALDERVTVYNFEVEDFHTYFVAAEGLWVHNDCEGKDGANGGEGERDPNAPEGGYERDPSRPDPNSAEGSTTRADEPGAGSPEHKAQRWKEYQERGGQWDYDRWSKTYENNMERARNAARAEEAYRDRLGWGRTQVTVRVEGVDRRLDIADVATQRGVEVKTGAQYATQENLWEIARDEVLREQGWDIRWHFEGHVSQPLKDALDKAGIPYDIDP